MRRATWLAVCISLWGATALATQVIGLDVEELTWASDAIVEGRVTRVQSRWTAGGRLIVTEIDVEVASTLKGGAAEKVTLIQQGGTVGDLAQRVSGLASFREGEEVLLFLERQGSRRFAVTGLAQGKFRIQRQRDGRAALAVPEEIDATLLDATTRRPIESRLQAVELAELKARISRALTGRGPERP